MDWIINKDIDIFYFINSGYRSQFLDYFFSFLSHNLSFIIALTACFLFLTIKEYKKHFWLLLLLIGLSFLLADRISVLCFKEVFQRLRPSHALEDVNLVKMTLFSLVYDYKGGLYGFVSSHSANCFSLATIFSYYGRKYKPMPYILYVWAILVGYSRIYCGVHYPLDVLCGALLGIVIGIIIILLTRKLINYFLSLKTKS
ncbi:MAG: phosphatase PAP2 family protein [Bacteroidales bacterium]|jgi:undecaprenyl-diphosphatase|nr:phosphatase PAP2 family protein [Bacteroidales bacterium]